MKFFFTILLNFSLYSMSAFAEIKSVKIEPGLNLKFDNKEWNYQYVKLLSNVTPHILESIKKTDLKVIIQKETHLFSRGNKQSLITDKCLEADKFYRESKQGSAKSMTINNKKVCFIEMIKKEKNTYQILYPVNFAKDSYDLLSFAWQDKDDKNLQSVSSLVGANL